MRVLVVDENCDACGGEGTGTWEQGAAATPTVCPKCVRAVELVAERDHAHFVCSDGHVEHYPLVEKP